MPKKMVKQKCERCQVAFMYAGRKPNHLCLECSMRKCEEWAKAVHDLAESVRHART